MSIFSSANITDGNLVLKERTHRIKIKYSMHQYSIRLHNLGNWLIRPLCYRLRRTVGTYTHHTRALHVSVGNTGRQVLGTSQRTYLSRSCQIRRGARHQRREDVVQSKREVTVGAQSQVSSTVSTVSRCTGQLWTATCPQCNRWLIRFVRVSSHGVSYGGDGGAGTCVVI